MNEVVVESLWIEFLNKLETDWKGKYSQTGDFHDFDKVKKTKLAKDVSKDMRKTLKLSGNDIDISWQTLYSYIKLGGFKGISPKPMLVLVKYLGYENIKDFNTTSKLVQQLTRERTIGRQKSAPETPQEMITTKEDNKQNYISTLAILLGLSLFFISFLLFQFLTQPVPIPPVNELSMKEAISLVRNSNKLAFQLYKNPSNLRDTLLLDNYFTKHGSARTDILDITLRSHRLKKKLEKNSSDITVDVTNISVTEENHKGKPVIFTKEHWKLYWLDSLGQLIMSPPPYIKINDQQYYVVKENGKWLIDRNDY